MAMKSAAVHGEEELGGGSGLAAPARVGNYEGELGTVEKLKNVQDFSSNGGKSAAAWEGGMKNLRDVYPGVQEDSPAATTHDVVDTQQRQNAEESGVVEKTTSGSDVKTRQAGGADESCTIGQLQGAGSKETSDQQTAKNSATADTHDQKANATQGAATVESGDDQRKVSDLNEMLAFYEQEVGKSMGLCEQPPPESLDVAENPITTAENQSKESSVVPAADVQELGPQTPPSREPGSMNSGTKEEAGSPRPGLIKSLVGTKIVPLMAPLVSVVNVVGESTAAILVGRGEDTAAAEAGSEWNESTQSRAVVEPTTLPKEAPILGRVENLESQMDSLEERQSPTGSEQQQPRFSVSSLGSPRTPSSLEKRCRPAKDVLEETEVKGTLVERVESLEQRLNQVVAPETVVEGGGISSTAAAVTAAQEEPVQGATKEELGEKQEQTAIPLAQLEEPVQGTTKQELEQGQGEEEKPAVPVTSPAPIVTEPDEPSTATAAAAAAETEVPKEDEEEVPVETEALDETVVETIIVPKPTPEAHAQVGDQDSMGAPQQIVPQQQKQQTDEKGKKKHFQKLRAALRRLFKSKSAS